MDATVQTILTGTVLPDFASDVFTQLGTILPIALPVTITIAVTFLAVRWFRALAHV